MFIYLESRIENNLMLIGIVYEKRKIKMIERRKQIKIVLFIRDLVIINTKVDKLKVFVMVNTVGTIEIFAEHSRIIDKYRTHCPICN